MKIKEGFMLSRVGNQAVVVAVGKASRDFNGLIRLNDTGEFMWKKLSEPQGISEEQLVAHIVEEYDVGEETARRDAAAFIAKLKEAGLLE